MAQVNKKIRTHVTTKHIEEGIEAVRGKLRSRLRSKGTGSYASRHEVFGILAEEMDELLEALRKDGKRGRKEFTDELLDVAVGALFGYICSKYKYL